MSRAHLTASAFICGFKIPSDGPKRALSQFEMITPMVMRGAFAIQQTRNPTTISINRCPANAMYSGARNQRSGNLGARP